MTLTERIKELDRLYLNHQRDYDAWLNAKGSKERANARRRMLSWWNKYVALRDSKKGMKDDK